VVVDRWQVATLGTCPGAARRRRLSALIEDRVGERMGRRERERIATVEPD